ncbi:MAG: hypothetical protein ACRDHF_04710 [Tepidiformaceae bacterium]
MNTGPDPTVIPAVQLISVVEVLEREAVPYAVGGAVALGYWSPGRGTEDIDFNIFLPASRAPEIFALLTTLGVTVPQDATATVNREDQIRTKWGAIYVGLFFAYDEVHEECRRRAVRVEFGTAPTSTWMWALCAEHCVFFKVLFNRPKDWLDIERVLRFAPSAFDVEYTVHWLERALGPEDRALQRFRDLWAEVSADNAER